MHIEERLSTFLKKNPSVSDEVYIAPSATVVGDVRIGRDASIWYGAILRGDINFISIGEGTNLQDGVIGHLADEFPLIVGNFVTVGHGAILHACEIGDESLIGMSATILDGAKIGAQCIIAAGTVVPMGMEIPDGSLVAGVPGKIKQSLPRDRRDALKEWAEKYIHVKNAHAQIEKTKQV